MTKPFRQVRCYHVNFMKFYRTTKTVQIGRIFKIRLYQNKKGLLCLPLFKNLNQLPAAKNFITNPIILNSTVEKTNLSTFIQILPTNNMN